MARTNYTSKGERRNVSKWVRKAIKRERTGLQRLNAQIDAFLEGKNVVLTIPNPNPNEASSNITKGETVTCTVLEIKTNGIDVTIHDGTKAFIRKADLSRDKAEQRVERFAVGEKVDAQITNVDKTGKKVSLSIKSLELSDEKEALEQYGTSSSGASLGDILGAAIKRQSSTSEDDSIKKDDKQSEEE